ncbi:MAG TPA: TonB-dependent receptor [Terriglobales bacterium]|nr:TonB-dependent receptor [Terriglobales bacterium]
MKPSRMLLLLAATVLMMPGSSFPQEATARIVGTVADPTGAVVPGVQITVTNMATQVSRSALTNQDGYYQVLALPIGNYKVTAEHEGFRKVESGQYNLLINQALRVDIQLRVGATAQTVEVGAQASAVETVNSTLGQSVTGRELINMPLNGRDTLDLALLQPGITESNDDNGGAGNYSIAGGRTDSVTFLLDGGNNNDLLDNSNLLDPNPDAIAEFRLLTSNYTAEYGRNGGGIISIVTKSGTNHLHGSLFEFFRNRVLDANDFFNIQQGIPRLDLKRNQYGATLGGPIVKDKVFFFLAYQGQRQVSAVPDIDAPVFTPLEVQGNFSQSASGAPDPGVVLFLQQNPYFQSNPALAAQAIIDPTKISSVAQNYIKAGLIPSAPGGSLSTTLGAEDDRDELTSKFDFNLSGKDKISATVGLNRQGNPYSGTLNPFPFATVPGFASRTEANYYFTNIGYTRVFSPTLLNEFHFVTHRSNYVSDVPANHLPTPASLGIGVTPDVPTGPTNLYFDTGLQLGNSENGPTRYVENTFSWTDSVTWTRGKHNWKFGGGFTPYQENLAYDFIINGEFDFYFGEGSNATGNPYADFMLGIPGAYFQGAKAPSNIRQKNTYVFGQDEWHAHRNLVLTLGLRYEYSTPKLDTEGRSFSVIPGLQSHRFVNAPTGLVFPGDPGVPKGTNFPDKNNFAPRFGFAWDPRGNGKTSIRGGFGMFYDILKGEDNLQYNGQPPFVGSAGLFFNPVGPGSAAVNYMTQPFVAAGVPNSFPSQPPGSNVSFAPFVPIGSSGFLYVDDPHLRTPYVYQYNLSVQRNLIADTVFEANYVGSSSHGLTSVRDIDPMILGTTTRVLDQLPGNSTCGTTVQIDCFGQIPEFQNVANANYSALEASLTRQPKTSKLGTVYYTFAYTFAHNLDNASGFEQRNSTVPAYDPRIFYASGDSDVRHRISLSGGWDLPFDRAWSGGPKRLTKGWSLYPILTWRTGFPFDIGASLPSSVDPANPGTSGAGDAYLTNAAVVGPIQTFDPRHQRTINEITYNFSPTGTCQITTTPVTGNFYFNPNSFSNVPLENYDYYDGGVPNPCFPQIDPVNNPKDRTYGLHRNTLRGPGLTNLDLAVAKTTAITEHIGLEFRAEFFNALNHPEFAQPTHGDGATNINSLLFGQITTTGTFRGPTPRIGQLALRLTF